MENYNTFPENQRPALIDVIGKAAYIEKREIHSKKFIIFMEFIRKQSQDGTTVEREKPGFWNDQLAAETLPS